MSFNKPFDQIAEADLRVLVTLGVAENRDMDYKQELPGNTDAAKKEFLADLSSMANAIGGYMVFGMTEANGVPTGICGIGNRDPDAEILRLESMHLAGIEPRLPGVQMRAIPLPNGDHVIIVHVPRSTSAPHVVWFQQNSKFHSRNSAGKYQLDVWQIRSAFLSSQTALESIRHFRQERLELIASGNGPVRLQDNPKIILQIVPFSSFSPPTEVEIAVAVEGDNIRDLAPINFHGADDTYNSDGFLVFHRDTSYTQLFRNGAVEAVESYMLGHERSIPARRLEAVTTDALTRYFRSLSRMEVDPPVYVMLSILGASGYPLRVDDTLGLGLPDVHGIDRDRLLLPEVRVDLLDTDPNQILRPSFDRLWNAAGWDRCRHYDLEGNYRPPRR